MKRNWKILFGLVIAVVLFSCSKEETTDFKAEGDVYFIKRKVDGELKYANAYYVYTNTAMSTATVTTPNSEVVTLESEPANNYTFFYEPAKTDFVSMPPVEGEYQFDILTKKDELAQFNDLLVFEELNVADITETLYNTEAEFIEISWGPVAGADGFVVKIKNTNGEIVYLSYSLEWDANAFDIGKMDENWETTPVNGETYLLEVHAFIYEDDATEENNFYNLKAITIGEKEIVWGE